MVKKWHTFVTLVQVSVRHTVQFFGLKLTFPLLGVLKGGECLMSVTYYQQLNHVYNFNEIQYRSSLQKFVKQP